MGGAKEMEGMDLWVGLGRWRGWTCGGEVVVTAHRMDILWSTGEIEWVWHFR